MNLNRKYMIEQDLIETIIALPTDLFYNTNICIYIFILLLCVSSTNSPSAL